MKTAGCLHPNCWWFAAESPSLLFIFLQLWSDGFHNICWCFNWAICLSFVVEVSSSIVRKVKTPLQKTMADNPVTADKLTSQSVVSFGWIAEISNNTNLQRTFDEEKTWQYFTEMVEATLPSSFPLLEQTLTTSAAFCFWKGKYLWKEKNGGKRKGKKKKFQFLLLLPCWGKLYFVKIGFLYTMWHGPVDVLLYKDNVYTQYLCFFLLLLLLFCFIFFYTMYIFYTVFPCIYSDFHCL